MPFVRDSLSTLIDKTLADIAARLGGSNPFLRRSVLNVLGRVLAAQHNDELGYLDWQSRMAIPVTARGEYLDAWSALRGVYRKAPAYASGTASVVDGLPGAVIPIGAQYLRSDGALYEEANGATLDGGGDGTLTLYAIDAGIGGNSAVGAPLRLVAPILGVPDTATVITMTGGSDLETDDALLARMLQAYAAPPQGGDLADYIRWALEVPEVTRAWAGGPTIMGAGTVTVYFMIDDDLHTGGSPPAYGIPIGSNGVSQYETRDTAATGDQLVVADHIYPLRPVTALVYAAAPIPVPLDLTIDEVPVDATIRAGIVAALEGFLLREASPGGVTLADLSAGGTVYLSHLEDAIGATPNLDHFVLVSPTTDITVSQGEISVPGSITFL